MPGSWERGMGSGQTAGWRVGGENEGMSSVTMESGQITAVEAFDGTERGTCRDGLIWYRECEGEDSCGVRDGAEVDEE